MQRLMLARRFIKMLLFSSYVTYEPALLDPITKMIFILNIMK